MLKVMSGRRTDKAVSVHLYVRFESYATSAVLITLLAPFPQHTFLADNMSQHEQ